MYSIIEDVDEAYTKLCKTGLTPLGVAFDEAQLDQLLKELVIPLSSVDSVTLNGGLILPVYDRSKYKKATFSNDYLFILEA